jgi:hypothetical protein
MAILLTAGEAGGDPRLLPLLNQVSAARVGPGRPRRRPHRVLAAKAYSRPSTLAALRARGIAVGRWAARAGNGTALVGRGH